MLLPADLIQRARAQALCQWLHCDFLLYYKYYALIVNQKRCFYRQLYGITAAESRVIVQDYKMRCRGGISAEKNKQHRVAVLLSVLKSASFIAEHAGANRVRPKVSCSNAFSGIIWGGCLCNRDIFYLPTLNKRRRLPQGYRICFCFWCSSRDRTRYKLHP